MHIFSSFEKKTRKLTLELFSQVLITSQQPPRYVRLCPWKTLAPKMHNFAKPQLENFLNLWVVQLAFENNQMGSYFWNIAVHVSGWRGWKRVAGSFLRMVSLCWRQ